VQNTGDTRYDWQVVTVTEVMVQSERDSHEMNQTVTHTRVPMNIPVHVDEEHSISVMYDWISGETYQVRVGSARGTTGYSVTQLPHYKPLQTEQCYSENQLQTQNASDQLSGSNRAANFSWSDKISILCFRLKLRNAPKCGSEWSGYFLWVMKLGLTNMEISMVTLLFLSTANNAGTLNSTMRNT